MQTIVNGEMTFITYSLLTTSFMSFEVTSLVMISTIFLLMVLICQVSNNTGLLMLHSFALSTLFIHIAESKPVIIDFIITCFFSHNCFS